MKRMIKIMGAQGTVVVPPLQAHRRRFFHSFKPKRHLVDWPCRALREWKQEGCNRGQENERCGIAIQLQSSVRDVLVEEVAYDRAKRPRENEGRP